MGCVQSSGTSPGKKENKSGDLDNLSQFAMVWVVIGIGLILVFVYLSCTHNPFVLLLLPKSFGKNGTLN